MARQYESISPELREWLLAQPVYFVGTAPSGPDGHVNVSPKGAHGTFRIMGPNRVAYLDLIGSGIETVAHLRENGRIVLMFCAFSGPPNVVRLHGQGRFIQQSDPEFEAELARFEPSEETRGLMRSIVVIEVSRVSDSCGFVVPKMEFVEERNVLPKWAEQKRLKWGSGWKDEYIAANNLTSVDALPGLDTPTLTDPDLLPFRSSDGKAL